VSGEIATSILGAQEGGEASFASLYELTNPALVRYLRVVSDADATNLALTAWTTLLRRLPSSKADENAWLELVVGVARLTAEDARQRESWSHLVDPTDHLPAIALADLETAGIADGPADSTVTRAAPSPPQGADAPPGATSPDEVTDGVDSTIAALRMCPPDEADLLAMRATAWLDREAICRLTGRDPASVRAVLDQALEHVGLPLFMLVKALRAPAGPDELNDLPVVLHLFTNGPAERRVAAVGTAAAAVAAVGAVGQPSLVNLLDVPAAPASGAAGHAASTAAGAASHLGWVGATAAAAAIAVGGVGAAWNGLLPDLFGGHGQQKPPSAGPARTGPRAGGDTGQQGPPTTGRQPATSPGTPAATKPEAGAGQTATGAGAGTVSLGRVELTVQVVSVSGDARGAGAVVTGTPSPAPPTGPTAPPPSQVPTTPESPPPTTPTAHGPGNAKGHTKTHPGKAKGHTETHGQGNAKGHTKTHPGKAKGHAKAPAQGKDKGHAKAPGESKAEGHSSGHAKQSAPSGGGKRTPQG
jgi:hypothetical protein